MRLIRFRPYRKSFNVTLTYSFDADVPRPYVQSCHLPPDTETTTSTDSQLMERIQQKSKMAAWFVSNCREQSKRHRYVKKLNRFLNVDIYGKCGKVCLFYARLFNNH